MPILESQIRMRLFLLLGELARLRAHIKVHQLASETRTPTTHCFVVQSDNDISILNATLERLE